ncbi:hypothetical protein GGR56DRAFT_509463 [Xylariaceae sp. FL0804]|nr:hypothetical protein GGR56DRAFT_509463 [Xylariaceae sp. FL0804]
MPSSKPKPSEVAAETKRHYIPLIIRDYAHQWATYSWLYAAPLNQLTLPAVSGLGPPPQFVIYPGDPVDYAINWKQRTGNGVPFICAANDKRPGGDWQTGVIGYEERLCRRSTLSATLSIPGPQSTNSSHYPIPSEGAIYSPSVVVFRGPHDHYQKLDCFYDLPVLSLPATRWPKLSQMGQKYAFPIERDLIKNKIRAALWICLYNGHSSIVIGDFGLGNGHRNPPQELAEIWREIFLYDPDIRGRFQYVAFVFEDVYQSTAKLILDDIAKKSRGGHSGSSKGKSKSHSSSSSSSASGPGVPTDMEIFQHIFSAGEIHGVISRPDPRYGISMLTS